MMSKRYNDTMLMINEHGFDVFLQAIKDLDNNGWFHSWKPSYDWFCDPNKFLRVIEGTYKEGKQNEDGEWSAEERERMERWLNDEE